MWKFWYVHVWTQIAIFTSHSHMRAKLWGPPGCMPIMELRGMKIFHCRLGLCKCLPQLKYHSPWFGWHQTYTVFYVALLSKSNLTAFSLNEEFYMGTVSYFKEETSFCRECISKIVSLVYFFLIYKSGIWSTV